MVKIQCHFRAKSLFTPVTIHVLLPSFFAHANTVESLDEVYKDNKFNYKTLFLLHGGVEDAQSWLSYTNIEKYADKHHMAVVLPSVGNSFYADLAHGPAYWTFVSDELPRFVRSVFPLSDKPEDNFVAGLSMGGYGALKLAFNMPDKFAAVASLSGAADIISVLTQSPGPSNLELEDYFDSMDALKGSNNDLYALLKKQKEAGTKLPRLYMACGTEDFIYDMNKDFLKYAKSLNVDITYEEGPGAHTWEFWDEYIQKVLDWMDL
jgi:putative tributyrin esterase